MTFLSSGFFLTVMVTASLPDLPWSSHTRSWKVYWPGTALTRYRTGSLHVFPTTSPAAGDESCRAHSQRVIYAAREFESFHES